MKLSVLLVTLLVLSWISAEDVGEKEILSQDSDDNNPEPLGNKDPQNTEEVESELGQETPTIRVSRSTARSNLEWVSWRGSIPEGAVSIWNDKANRAEYVCIATCTPGYYTPSRDAKCYYPYLYKEQSTSSFYMLVNKDDFELLEWKAASWGNLPKNSIERCDNLYVAKNKYGLGKVHIRNKCFYYSWHGKEEWTRDYEALSFSTDIAEQTLSNVKYNTNKITVHKSKPETLRKSGINNYQCRTVTKKVTLMKTIQTEQRWDISGAVTFGVSTSVKAGIPNIADVSLKVSVETSVEISHGTRKVDSTTHSVSVITDVPPNHYCSVTLEGVRYRASIPFTGRLTRKYGNGKVSSTSVSGTYKKVQVGEIRAVAHRCSTIKGAKRC